MFQAYVAQALDTGDLDVKTSVLLAWNPVYTDTENGTRVGSFRLEDNEINFETITDGDTIATRRVIDDINLLPNVMALVTENTGRAPLVGDRLEYGTGGILIWVTP